MDIRPQTYVWIACLFFSWKCEQVTGTKMNTWKQAVLDCYEYNSSLESNMTVLKNYMGNHTEVSSIWVNSFEALLPWIEIRGCYNISVIRNSLNRDEHVVENSALCQLKCMNRRYFAFSQKNETCVCFDEHDVVKRESDNASFCQEYIHQGHFGSYAVVYKVFDKSMSEAGYDIDCLTYACSSKDAKPTFHKTRCLEYSLSYCRDGLRVGGSKYLQFSKYRSSCEEDHFTYPLLHSENPVKLCNVIKLNQLGIDMWVGVYRQKLHMENLEKTELQDINQIWQYISHCNHLSTNGTFVKTDNCCVKHYYKCTSGTSMDVQKETNNSLTSTHVCRSEVNASTTDYISSTTKLFTADFHDESTSRSTTAQINDTVNNATGTEESRSGMIAGVTVPLSVVMLIVVVILAIVYRKIHRRNHPLSRKLGKGERTSKMNQYTIENIPQGHYHEIDISNGDYCIANSVPDNAVDGVEAEDEEATYVRATSGIYDKLNEKDKRKVRTKYPNENASKLQEEKMEIYTLTSNLTINEQCKDDILNNAMSSDYCIAKPIADAKYVEKDKSTKAYDQWHMTHAAGTDPTYDHSKNIIQREEQSNYDHCSIKK